ncbi:hypothetical protein B0H11DRAFT_1906390 [Mycena galericulata]|nr:hypothetical protein B0H11DRAFT_1906390 [Mycena galericulata]
MPSVVFIHRLRALPSFSFLSKSTRNVLQPAHQLNSLGRHGGPTHRHLLSKQVSRFARRRDLAQVITRRLIRTTSRVLRVSDPTAERFMEIRRNVHGLRRLLNCYPCLNIYVESIENLIPFPIFPVYRIDMSLSQDSADEWTSTASFLSKVIDLLLSTTAWVTTERTYPSTPCVSDPVRVPNGSAMERGVPVASLPGILPRMLVVGDHGAAPGLEQSLPLFGTGGHLFTGRFVKEAPGSHLIPTRRMAFDFDPDLNFALVSAGYSGGRT